MMKFDEKLKEYGEKVTFKVDERNVTETIKVSQKAFFAKEQQRVLTYWEFLWSQFRLIKKKWWILQAILLTMFSGMIPYMQEEFYTQRSLGIIASLFVVLIIPELWKNRTNHCMEIESCSYYTLRQIYASRMLLFGVVDTLLITAFCGFATTVLHYTLMGLVVQFLFPMLVTACICFGILSSKYALNEMFAIILCVLWSSIWWLITVNENLYAMVTYPIWIAIFCFAIVSLTIIILRMLNGFNKQWEVNYNGVKS